MYRIEVSVKEGYSDPRAEGLEKDILDLGITAVSRARVSDIYMLDGDISAAELETICSQLLADPIIEEYSTTEHAAPTSARVVEVAYNPGVMDPVEESVRKGIVDLNRRFEIKDRGIVQVSINMVNFKGTPLFRVFEMVKSEAERYGVPVIGSEIVGLVPADALIDVADFYLRFEDFARDQVLENRLSEGEEAE